MTRVQSLLAVLLVVLVAIVGTALAGSGGEKEQLASAQSTAKKALKTAKQARKIAKATAKEKGPTGPAGPAGPAGADELSRWAVVAADGTLVRGRGVVSSTKLFVSPSDGAYQVTFDGNVTDCAFVATVGRTDDAPLDPDQGEIGVAYRNGNPNAAYVMTRASDGAESARSFHIVAAC